MTDELTRLIEEARRRPPMTPEELEEQRVSFAYGNVHYEDRRVTREMVARISATLGVARDGGDHVSVNKNLSFGDSKR